MNHEPFVFMYKLLMDWKILDFFFFRCF